MSAIGKLLPGHLTLLNNPHMMEQLGKQAVIKIGGLDELVAWAKRSDENQGKLYAMVQRAAPKRIEASVELSYESYLDARDARRAEAAGVVIEGESKRIEGDQYAEHRDLFLWPDVMHVDHAV